ncbi:hypothetical protein [Fluviispira vulneris]|uniref:hypothetical protein n=1 Tax=Fluviispira vulneris TaxID=2763012 RepID=UPI001648BB9C|nr:hypothetical protein [Fluviispira vulneris]
MKKILTDEQKNYYAKRITHYLKGFRSRSQFSPQDTANSLGMSESNYRKLEIDGYPEESKFMSAIETLYAFGSLEDMSLYDFAYYLENPNTRTFSEIKSGTTSQERALFGWEKYLIEKFHNIDIDTRTEYMDIFITQKESNVNLERIIKFSILINEYPFKKMSSENIKIFDALLEYFFSKNNNSKFNLENARKILISLLSERK